MKISASSSFLKQDHKIPLKTNVTVPLRQEPSQIKSLSSIPFYGLMTPHSESFYEASNYIKETHGNLFKSFDKTKPISLSDLSLNKLEGIQEGIDVFKGLSIKEIAFVFNNPHYILASRACNNGCEHCYASAPALVSKKSPLVSKAQMEDFTSFLDGTNELESRLGFKLFNKKNSHVSFVYDSDNLLVEQFDKNGKTYDFVDLAEMVHEKLGVKVLFDTAGWVPTNQKMQQRAERIVNYFAKDDNYQKAYQINISVNPFHELMTLSRKYEQMGNLEKALEKRSLYTDRMANSIFTFTPIIDTPNFNLLQNALEDSPFTKKGCREGDLELLDSDILEKIKQKFMDDFKGKQKYIKSSSLIPYYTDVLEGKFEYIRMASPIGKGKQFFPTQVVNEIAASERDTLAVLKKSPSKKMVFTNLIDVNGGCYYANNNILIPSEINLNYSTQNRPSVPFKDVSDLKITKQMLEKDS